MPANGSATERDAQGADYAINEDPLDLHLRTSHELGDDLDLSAVLRQVLSITMRSVSAEAGSILLFDEGGWPSHWFILNKGQGKFVPSAQARAITKRGIAAWVIRQRQGDMVNDLANDPRWLPLFDFPLPVEQGAALCLPLLTYDRVIGVLTLVHPSPGAFQPHHLNLLQSIAKRVALSVENARLYETVRQQAEEMTALHEATLNVSADQPLERLLETIVAHVMDLLHCQGGGVFLWREREAMLELVAAYDPEIDLRGTRVAPGEGLAGRVFETGDSLAVDEYGGWGGLSPHTIVGDVFASLPATAALAVPLTWQEQPVGVLMATDRTPRRHFGHHDQHLLSWLASQSAMAIASVQLHERTSRRLQELVFLNETIQAITATLDLDEIFSILTRRVNDLLSIEACSIALVDRETNELVFRAAAGGGAEIVIGKRIPWGQGIVGATALAGESINVPDVRRDERFYKEVDKEQTDFVTQSILAVPMIHRGQVVGVVEAFNKRGEFDAEDERLLSALASLAASVVENANLFNSARAAEMRYQALFEDAADAAWVTDTTGRVIQVNRKASALTGYSSEAMLGTALWTLTLPAEGKTWRTALTQALAGEEAALESWIVDVEGVSHPLELRVKRVWLQDSLDVGVQPTPMHVQWIGRDISARHQLEQLRETLTHMIVHDLRSPVGTISSSLDLLDDLVQEQGLDQATPLLAIASQANQRLATLVNSLLDFSRLEAGQELTDRQPVSLRTLIQAATDQLALYAQRKRIRLNVALPAQLPLILADGGMIERVLINLIDNALKFTPADNEVNISVEERKDSLWVRVRDSGPGIPPEHQHQIFEKFARVQGQVSVGGIGLGLAFCRLAVEAHGGRIWVESLPGQGSTFVFILPLE
jgi:NtrC-family two-component system sensor histidine kinase KinB